MRRSVAERLKLAATIFARSSVELLEEERGTRYADGGEDLVAYFRAANGNAVVAEYDYVSDKVSARRSDQIVFQDEPVQEDRHPEEILANIISPEIFNVNVFN